MDENLKAMAVFLHGCYNEAATLAQAAHEADPAPWVANASDDGYTNQRGHDHGAGLVFAADGEPLWDCEGSDTLCMSAASTRHAALHDPLAVLSDIDAKRKRLADLVRAIEAGHDAYDLAAALLPLEALAYSWHPNYEEAWRP